jgi:hypothetical protein
MRNYFKNLNIAYIFIVATISFLYFILKAKTAYEWPALDMMPFFERYYDKSFLINDFFTNAVSNDPNPRWVFGYFIIFLSNLFNVDWYVVSYTMKVVFSIGIPVLYYLVLFTILKKYINGKKLKSVQILILFAIIIVIYPNFASIFSVAGWSPFFIQSIPQTLSLAFGLLAIVFINYGSKVSFPSGILLFTFATLIHPAISFFSLLFYILSNINSFFRDIKNNLYIIFFGFIVPVTILKIFFSIDILDANEFIKIYVFERHSHHYFARVFLNFFLGGTFSILIIIIALVIPLTHFITIRKNQHSIFIGTFLIVFVVSIISQHIFIEIFPSKAIASLGPVRFSIFAYWMIVISWILMLSNWQFLIKCNFESKYEIYFVIIMLSYIVFGTLLIDNPKENIYIKNKKIYKFIQTTSPDSVFATDTSDNLNVDLQTMKRAVFFPSGFPFNEKYFREYYIRNKLLYGTRDTRIDNILNTRYGLDVFFRKLKPNDFLNASKQYKLDYIIIKNKYSENFKKFEPVFKNKKVKIYKISDFKECK